MGLFDDFATNGDAEKDGVWVDYGDYSLKIKRAGGRNTAYTREFTKAIKPHRRGIASGAASEDRLRKALAPIYARYVLVDWRGVKVESTGEEIPYSYEKALELLLAMPDFYDEVRDKSNDGSYFHTEGTEIAAGN